MSFKVVADRQLRFVRVEHTCNDSGRTFRGATDPFGADVGRIVWDFQDNKYCAYCGEHLPQNISELESQSAKP